MSSWSVRSPGMPERRMAQVVREAHRLDQVGVDVEVVPERAVQRPQVVADRAPDLRHLHRVREARAVEVVFAREEDLGLRLELAEGVRVDDPVAVDLERVAVVGLPRAPVGLAVEGSVESVGHLWGGSPWQSARPWMQSPRQRPRRSVRGCFDRIPGQELPYTYERQDDACDLQAEGRARAST